MGVNQSSQSRDLSDSSSSHGITVVNPTPDKEPNQEENALPDKVLPILTIEGHTIDATKHGAEVQLNHQSWVDFVTTIDKYSNSRADLVAGRQSQLQEKIILVDGHVQVFTDSYINDTHKALARMNEDCRQIEDIQKLLQKCTTQSELCINMLNHLNFLLPDDNKLEPLGLESSL